MSSSQAAAFDQVTLSPVVTANVTIRSAAPVVDLGYDAYYWGGQYFADFVIADWVGADRLDPNRQTVLTFYGGNTASVADQPNERIKLLTTPFSSYEDSLRSDMNRVLAGRNFDFDRDVTAVYLNRWGHSMVYPKPGWPFSAPIIGSGGSGDPRPLGALLRPPADRPHFLRRTRRRVEPCERKRHRRGRPHQRRSLATALSSAVGIEHILPFVIALYRYPPSTERSFR